MRLKDVLNEFCNRDFQVIEYRSVRSIDSDDVDYLIGFCKYINHGLVSVDGDSYSLNDQVEKYDLYRDDWLVVWV